jgi:hypothetical protein
VCCQSAQCDLLWRSNRTATAPSRLALHAAGLSFTKFQRFWPMFGSLTVTGSDHWLVTDADWQWPFAGYRQWPFTGHYSDWQWPLTGHWQLLLPGNWQLLTVTIDWELTDWQWRFAGYWRWLTVTIYWTLKWLPVTTDWWAVTIDCLLTVTIYWTLQWLTDTTDWALTDGQWPFTGCWQWLPVTIYWALTVTDSDQSKRSH